MIFNDESTSDFIVAAEGKPIYVHRQILLAHSPFLRDFLWKDPGCSRINANNALYDSMCIALKGLYDPVRDETQLFSKEQRYNFLLVLSTWEIAMHFTIESVAVSATPRLLALIDAKNVLKAVKGCLKHPKSKLAQQVMQQCLQYLPPSSDDPVMLREWTEMQRKHKQLRSLTAAGSRSSSPEQHTAAAAPPPAEYQRGSQLSKPGMPPLGRTNNSAAASAVAHEVLGMPLSYSGSAGGRRADSGTTSPTTPAVTVPSSSPTPILLSPMPSAGELRTTSNAAYGAAARDSNGYSRSNSGTGHSRSQSMEMEFEPENKQQRRPSAGVDVTVELPPGYAAPGGANGVQERYEKLMERYRITTEKGRQNTPSRGASPTGLSTGDRERYGESTPASYTYGPSPARSQASMNSASALDRLSEDALKVKFSSLKAEVDTIQRKFALVKKQYRESQSRSPSRSTPGKG